MAGQPHVNDIGLELGGCVGLDALGSDQGTLHGRKVIGIDLGKACIAIGLKGGRRRGVDMVVRVGG